LLFVTDVDGILLVVAKVHYRQTLFPLESLKTVNAL